MTMHCRNHCSGSRVQSFLYNRAEYLICYFACFKLGAWAGPVHALLQELEVAFVLGDSQPAVAVTQASLLPVLSEAASGVFSLRSVIVVDSDAQ